MKTVLSTLWITLIICISPLPSFAHGGPSVSSNPEKYGWRLRKETKNIKVYDRKSKNSRVNEIKLSTTVESSLSALVSLLRDVPNYPNWIYKCSKASSIGSTSPELGGYYSELDFPWPLQNRDFIARSYLSQDKKTKVVTIRGKSIPTHFAEKEGMVRIETLDLLWILTPLSGGRVKIDYELLSDPGGILPAWLVNLAVDQGPTQTIKALRQQVNKSKYRQARLSYIEEL